ncbi:hypothetical protein FHP25_00325 [Vineibacter terrae]|uniref:Lipoprotein n=1 Tax=Vineibacter terrae TaxID=2586908 RepID=A0A5C8PW41_9HYPH|nr:hypothetical protein [Vineibacter terrae]TXL82183.1 hypothetical protein FHP25_00325 [Vineibacter terrae]
MRLRIAIASALLLLAGCGQPQPEVGSPAKVCVVPTDEKDRLMPAAPGCGDAGALALSAPQTPVDFRR